MKSAPSKKEPLLDRSERAIIDKLSSAPHKHEILEEDQE